MPGFLKRLFSRRPPQQLVLEVGPHSPSRRVPKNDHSWPLIAVLLLGVTPMAASQADSGPDSEEYAIYSLVLNQLRMIDDSYVVINDHTIDDRKPFTPIKQRLQSASRQMRGGIPRQIRTDFETKNQIRYRLENHFKLKVKVVFLSQTEIDRLVLPEWIDFLKKYPAHGLIELSRVGFNARRDRALVYTGSQGGPKSGAGFLILLSKTNGNWVIDQKIFAWVS